MTKEFEAFRQNMAKDGVWVLNDAPEATKTYVKRNSLERYEEEIKKYKTPQKFIKRGEEIIVVSLTKEMWAGIEIFNMNELIFRESDGIITIMKEKGRSKKLISAVEDMVDNKFISRMIDSGYLSKEEYAKYSTIKEQEKLTLVKTVVI